MIQIPAPTGYKSWEIWGSKITRVLLQLANYIGLTDGRVQMPINSFTITGSIELLAFTTIPLTSLQCDGTVYNIVDYPDLFNVISNTFGGDGITTFAVPNIAAPLAGTVYSIAHTGRPPV